MAITFEVVSHTEHLKNAIKSTINPWKLDPEQFQWTKTYVFNFFNFFLPADVSSHLVTSDGDHVLRHRRVSRQPVGVVIARSVATGALSVAEQVGHGGEARQAASHGAWRTVSNVRQGTQGWAGVFVHTGFCSLTKILAMGSLISVDEEERITRVD